MRKWIAALLLVSASALYGCRSQPSAENYTSADANEDAALNALQDEDNEAVGAGVAVSGMIPDSSGSLPMANVQ